MWFRAVSALLLLPLGAVACGRSARAARVACAAATRPAWTRDSTVALCLPVGFAPAGDGFCWERGAPADPGRAWLSVRVLDSAQVAGGAARGWPPSFRDAPGRAVPDGYTVDSLVVHRDTVGGVTAVVETGLLSGGFAGETRAPALLAAWRVAPGRWALAQGWAGRPGTLDTLRAAIRSARVGEPGRGRRAAT